MKQSMMDRVEDKIDLEAFEEKYRDAKAYHKRAEQFLEEGQYYSVVFNVAAVALEFYLVALCELYGVEPGNHNYISLMNAVEEIVDVPKELNEEITSLDLIFGICSIENYDHGGPELSDSDRILAICDRVRKLFDPARISSVRAYLPEDNT